MSTLAGFRQINDLVEKEARFVQVLDAEIRKAIIGQDRLVERALVALLADGHILLEGVPGLAKTLLVKNHLTGNPGGVLAHPVHPRPAACGPHRHADIQPAHRRVQRSKRPGLFQPRPGRRGEPGAGKGAERTPGGDAGGAGNHRGRDLLDRQAVPGIGNPEPHRAGGYLPSARSAGGPFHAQGDRGLPGSFGGDGRSSSA